MCGFARFGVLLWPLEICSSEALGLFLPGQSPRQEAWLAESSYLELVSQSAIQSRYERTDHLFNLALPAGRYYINNSVEIRFLKFRRVPVLTVCILMDKLW